MCTLLGNIVGEGRFGGWTNLVTHVSSFPGGADISISLVGTQRGGAGGPMRVSNFFATIQRCFWQIHALQISCF